MFTSKIFTKQQKNLTKKPYFCHPRKSSRAFRAANIPGPHFRNEPFFQPLEPGRRQGAVSFQGLKN
jgi:hypothetical protein